jgi:small subunit ribosomal protein S5
MSEVQEQNKTQPTAASTPNQSQGQRPFQRSRFGGAGGNSRGNDRGANQRGGFKKKPRFDKKPRDEEQDKFEVKVLQVRRVTRVVKGGKRMRFSALVVVGDKQGKVGYGLEKGLDYQESVMKATRKAKESLITINISENGTVAYPAISKFKSSSIMLKPALAGTGLISGGFVRPVLELVGIKNIYSKIIGTNNKITGVKSVFKALEHYSTIIN